MKTIMRQYKDPALLNTVEIPFTFAGHVDDRLIEQYYIEDVKSNERVAYVVHDIRYIPTLADIHICAGGGVPYFSVRDEIKVTFTHRIVYTYIHHCLPIISPTPTPQFPNLPFCLIFPAP